MGLRGLLAFGLAYLVVQLSHEADPIETLSPFIGGDWQVPGLKWQVELDRRAADEEVALTAQDIADEEAFDRSWRFFPTNPDDLTEDELWSQIETAAW